MNPLIAEIEKSAALTQKIGCPQCNEYLSALAALKLAVEALEAVCRNDKTPAYEYGDKNALGHPPRQSGQRWNTPAEMARATIRAIAEKLGVKG